MRVRRDEMDASFTTFLTSFCHTFLSWIVIQWIIQLEKPKNNGWKALIALTACMGISLALFFLKVDLDMIKRRPDTAAYRMRAVYFLLLTRGFVIGSFLYFVAYLLRITSLNQQAKLENEQLKQENMRARLSLLQEQVNPHFLFNSLGTLRSMINEKAPRDFIQRLAEVYRYLLNSRMADLVDLRRELEFTNAYLYILKERFEEALMVTVDVGEDLYVKKLPPLTLQLLIENAVKHNVIDIGTPLNIHIYSKDGAQLVISNSLKRKQTVSSSLGTGLNNIRDRYRLLAGLEINITESDTEFTVTIPLLTT